MPKSYELKKREIKYSLNRRSRLRKAYFKLTGSERPVETLESKTLEAKDLNVDEPDSEDEQEKKDKLTRKPSLPQLTKKQLASRKRAEKYHKAKEAEERRQQAEIKRKIRNKRATARTKKGQPKLGSQVSLLLDKIKEAQN